MRRFGRGNTSHLLGALERKTLLRAFLTGRGIRGLSLMPRGCSIIMLVQALSLVRYRRRVLGLQLLPQLRGSKGYGIQRTRRIIVSLSGSTWMTIMLRR